MGVTERYSTCVGFSEINLELLAQTIMIHREEHLVLQTAPHQTNMTPLNEFYRVKA